MGFTVTSLSIEHLCAYGSGTHLVCTVKVKKKNATWLIRGTSCICKCICIADAWMLMVAPKYKHDLPPLLPLLSLCFVIKMGGKPRHVKAAWHLQSWSALPRADTWNGQVSSRASPCRSKGFSQPLLHLGLIQVSAHVRLGKIQIYVVIVWVKWFPQRHTRCIWAGSCGDICGASNSLWVKLCCRCTQIL